MGSGEDQRKHKSSASLSFFCGEFTGDRWIPRTKASNAENVSIWWRHHGLVQEKVTSLLMPWSYVFLASTHRHDDVIKWRHFPHYWPFVRGIQRSLIIPITKSSDAELWCFHLPLMFYWCLNKELGKQSRRRWYETPSRSLWCHCNESDVLLRRRNMYCSRRLLCEPYIHIYLGRLLVISLIRYYMLSITMTS